MKTDSRLRSTSMYGSAAIAALAAIACTACGGGGGSSAATPASPGGSGTTSNGSTAYVAAYQAAKWASAVTVSFSGSCSMSLTTTGVPPSHADYYLAPASAGQTFVAVTPVTNMPMAVMPYSATNIAAASHTFNVCPTKAATTTPTGLGAIGYTIAGEALFNPYEANGSTPALMDNVSYTFTAGGTSETASFIDSCNSHAAGGPGGATWHYHAVPTCLVAQLDGNGPSHLLGIALDGFPIYGGRDINGNVIPASALDACNGITSPTPDFPNGAYHYVLPIGVTGKQSSLNCYTGTAS